MKRLLVLLGAAALTAIVGFSDSASESFSAHADPRAGKMQSKGVERGGAVLTLHNLETLKERFQRDNGKVRMIALLSPT
ncbi:MAG TPA: hypothetical protein VNO70_06820 [Blastocatellia bacterium]|nr:hypothetical protein [Blastocatellia bacterium]